jgi:hypothetical protein
VQPVASRQLRRLKADLRRRAAAARPGRWNPDPDDVQRSVVRLVLTLVEFLRQLMERQALRRVDEGTLDAAQIEAVGKGLMQLEQAVHDLARRFGLSVEDLNLELGPLGRLL